MVEIRRGSDSIGAGERLPWLEPVEDEDGEEYGGGGVDGGGYGGVIVAAIAVLVGIAIVTAGIVWYRHRLAATADIGQIIRAPAEPYKVKAPEAARTDKAGEVANGTSAGQDIDSPIDLSALPEAPVPRTAPPPAASAHVQSQGQQPVPRAPAPTPAVAAPPKPVVVHPPIVEQRPAAPVVDSAAPVAAGPSATIQLGAFSSQAKAEAAWKTLSGRFAYLKPMAKSVLPVEADGKTLYRLRASGAGAAGACARLKVAGETCSAVGG